MGISEFNEPAAGNIARLIKEKGFKQVYIAALAGYTRLCTKYRKRKHSKDDI